MFVNTLTQLKNIADKFNGLALICLEKKNWYVYDIASLLTGNDNDVVTPTDGVGRWIALNNTSNIFNTTETITASSTSTEINNLTADTVVVVLNQNTNIQFPAVMRNGRFVVLLNRNGNNFTITSWDNAIDWGTGTPYNFSGVGIQYASIEFLCFNNNFYFLKSYEY